MNAQVIKPKQPKDFNSEWVVNGVDEPCLEFLEGFGFYLVDKAKPSDDRPGRSAMTTSQLRNIFSEAKQIESKVNIAFAKDSSGGEDWEKEIKSKVLLLRPKIAYATARALDRDRNSRMKAFGEVADAALRVASKDIKHYKNFINIFEAIIAYHKKYGGRDK